MRWGWSQQAPTWGVKTPTSHSFEVTAQSVKIQRFKDKKRLVRLCVPTTLHLLSCNSWRAWWTGSGLLALHETLTSFLTPKTSLS